MSQKAWISALLGTGPAATPNVSIQFQGSRPYTVTLTPRFGHPSIWVRSWWIIAANSSAVLFSFAVVGSGRPWLSGDSDRGPSAEFIFPSPSAHRSAHGFSRFPVESRGAPDKVEACERLLIASPPFVPALPISPPSFSLRLPSVPDAPKRYIEPESLVADGGWSTLQRHCNRDCASSGCSESPQSSLILRCPGMRGTLLHLASLQPQPQRVAACLTRTGGAATYRL
jgi:hypothetical protein